MLKNISDPQCEAHGSDGVGEGEVGFAIPGCGIGRAGRTQQIARPQRDKAVEAEQGGRCSRDCLVGPLPLGFDAEMCPGFCEGDLDLPAADEECDDVGWRAGGVGAEEGLRVPLAFGVSDKHPADWCWRCAGAAIPERGVRGDLERLTLLAAIPGGHGYSVPWRSRVREQGLQLGQWRALLRRAADGACMTLWWGREEIGIEPQPADEGCPGGDGVGQFVDGETAVADEDDVAVGQPAAELERPLAGPVGQQLVPAAVLAIGALRRREQGQHWQGFHHTCPRDRRQHHETQPTQAAGLDEMAMAGADGITVDATRGDLAAPPAFDGIIHPDDHRTIRHEAADDHGQQASRHGVGGPPGTVEDLMIA